MSPSRGGVTFVIVGRLGRRSGGGSGGGRGLFSRIMILRVTRVMRSGGGIGTGASRIEFSRTSRSYQPRPSQRKQRSFSPPQLHGVLSINSPSSKACRRKWHQSERSIEKGHALATFGTRFHNRSPGSLNQTTHILRKSPSENSYSAQQFSIWRAPILLHLACLRGTQRQLAYGGQK